ncbi:MAG TPA: SCO family protein [Noviherbaspirillum sp.]
MKNSQRCSEPAATGHLRRTVAASAVAFAVAAAATYEVTEGFRVLTTESARRMSVAATPRAVPDATLEFASGDRRSLSEALRTDGRVTIVSFIYTRCTAICSAIGTEFQQLQEEIRAKGLDKHVRLLSISFDPRDDAPQLAAYAQRMYASQTTWHFASIPDDAQRRQVLDMFGITVIPAPLGEFQHNGAFHIVSPDGFLTGIVDYEAPAAALAQARALLMQRPVGLATTMRKWT